MLSKQVVTIFMIISSSSHVFFPLHSWIFFFFIKMEIFIYLVFFAFSRATPAAYGGSKARGVIGAVAASLRQSHSNAGSKPHLQPTLQLTAMLDR